MERPPPDDDPFARRTSSTTRRDELDASARGPRGLIPEAVKKAILAGVGAVFMTEEGARRLAREWKLPKEVIGFVGQPGAGGEGRDPARGRRRDPALPPVGGAPARVPEGARRSSTIEVKMEIRLRPDADGAPRAEVKSVARGGSRGKKAAR